jgi:hypothetical protein
MFDFSGGRVGILMTLFAATLLAPSLGLASFHPTQSDAVRKEIEAQYARRDQAFKNKEFDFLKSQETSDYSEKMKDGEVRNKEECDGLADQMASMVKEVTDEATKVESVKDGDADGEYIVVASDSGRLTLATPDGQTHLAVGSSRGRDVWVKTDQGWKIKHHEQLESTFQIDGKTVN